MSEKGGGSSELIVSALARLNRGTCHRFQGTPVESLGNRRHAFVKTQMCVGCDSQSRWTTTCFMVAMDACSVFAFCCLSLPTRLLKLLGLVMSELAVRKI